MNNSALPPDVRALLARADEEEAAFRATHLTPSPSPEPKKVERVLSESEVNKLIWAALGSFADALGAETGAIEKRIVEKLMAEVGQLRAEIVVSSSGDKGVVNFGKWRSSDAA
jgi:hypothetical protein